MNTIVRRIIGAVPVLLGISFLVFLLMHLAPGDPVMLLLGDDATPGEVARVRHEWGLDQPLLLQYWQFISRAVIGDVRGMGMMQGMELVGEKKKPDAESTKRLMELTKNHGLLLGKGGTYGNVLRVSPPLNIDKEEVDQALKILDRSFAQLGQ